MNRRRFLSGAIATLGALATQSMALQRNLRTSRSRSSPATLFLCGDVMTGRGIDQVLPQAGAPVLFEPYVRDARRYVELAEERNGTIPRPVAPGYIWGGALAELERRRPHARMINLETAITTSDAHWPGKGIHYRMAPGNAGCLTAAGIDCCVLANNHVLDWGYPGLAETLATLGRLGVRTAGAGLNLEEAAMPALLELAADQRLIVFAVGSRTSGIPAEWGAAANRAGIHVLADLSDTTVRALAARISSLKRSGDLVVVSVHWGANWGHAIPSSHRRFARALIDRAGVDVVHGHSSHHPLGIEVHNERPILYGCGDFINDYEGIGSHEEYRGDLVLAYWLTMDPVSGRLLALEMTPYRTRRFRLETVPAPDVAWMAATLDRESRALGCRIVQSEDRILQLQW